MRLTRSLAEPHPTGSLWWTTPRPMTRSTKSAAGLASTPTSMSCACSMNGTQAVSLNEALDVVQTPLFMYMLGDDRMLAHRVESQVSKREAHRQRWSPLLECTPDRCERSRLRPDYANVNDWEHVHVLEGRLHTHLLEHNWIRAASVLLDTSAVREVGGYNEAWFSDHDLPVKACCHRTGNSVRKRAPGRDRPARVLVGERQLRGRQAAAHGGSARYPARPVRSVQRGRRLYPQRGSSLAVGLWRAGKTGLVGRAFRLPGLARQPRWLIRSWLVRLGLTREPRVLGQWKKSVKKSQDITCVHHDDSRLAHELPSSCVRRSADTRN